MRLNGAILVAAGMPVEAADVLASAAQILAPHESEAREALLEAYDAAVYAGPAATRRVVDLAQPFLPAEAEPTIADLLLEGFSARSTAGYERSVAPFRAAIQALGSDELDPATGLRWFSRGCVAAGSLWDDQALLDLSTRWMRTARTLGALASLPGALNRRAHHDVIAGRLDDADGRAAEARELLAVTENASFLSAPGWNSGVSLAIPRPGRRGPHRRLGTDRAGDRSGPARRSPIRPVRPGPGRDERGSVRRRRGRRHGGDRG
jgi:hypothetical protein